MFLDSGSGCGASGTGDTVVVADTVVAEGLLGMVRASSDIVGVVADVDAQARGVDVAVAPEKERSETGLGQDVQDTVESSLGVGSNDVATLGESPGNRVEEPEEGGQDTTADEGAVDISAESRSVLASSPDNGPGNPKEGEHSEDEVAPLRILSEEKLQRSGIGLPCRTKRPELRSDR